VQDTQAFAPFYRRSVQSGNPNASTAGTLLPSVTVTGSAAVATASTVFPGTNGNDSVQIQIANTTTAWAYVNFGVLLGGITVTAATVATGYPVAPGAVVAVTVDKEVNAASVILGAASTGGTTVIFTRGAGV
jgi:hypothetical protein